MADLEMIEPPTAEFPPPTLNGTHEDGDDEYSLATPGTEPSFGRAVFAVTVATLVVVRLETGWPLISAGFEFCSSDTKLTTAPHDGNPHDPPSCGVSFFIRTLNLP